MSVRSCWIEFDSTVIPEEASERQRLEMCKAFCSGFMAGTEELLECLAGMPHDTKVRILNNVERSSVEVLDVYTDGGCSRVKAEHDREQQQH